jgi:DNA repair exonuclease SbcCD nuclease subunit
MKILHTADWHYCDKNFDEILKNVDYLIEYAKNEQPDLIVHAGDTTDSQNIKLDSRSTKKIVEQFSRLADIAPVLVLLGTESHDGRTVEILEFLRCKYPIHVSSKPEQIFCDFGEFRYDIKEIKHVVNREKFCLISTCPPPSKKYFQSDSGIEVTNKEISQQMSAIFSNFGNIANEYGCTHILVGHFQVGGAFISEKQQLTGRDIEINAEQLAMANADLVCMGHIHKQQKIKDNIFYSGSIYRKTFGELDNKGFYEHNITFPNKFNVDLKKCYIDSKFIKVPAIEKIILEYNFIEDYFHTDELIWQNVFENKAYVKYAKFLIKIKIWQDDIKRIDKKKIIQEFLGKGALDCKVELDIVPREIIRNKEVNSVETLHEKLIVFAESRAELVETEIIDRIIDLENGMNSDALIKKYEVV